MDAFMNINELNANIDELVNLENEQKQELIKGIQGKELDDEDYDKMTIQMPE